MTGTSDDQDPARTANDPGQGMQIYCNAPNPDYEGRHCTKILKPEGGHLHPGGHNDGIYPFPGGD